MRLYQTILAESPDHVEAHRGYQNLLLSQGRERTVRDEYAKPLEEKRSPQRLFLYGRLLFDPVAEEKLYREGLQLAPDEQHLQAGLIDSLRRQRRVPEAIRECRRALAQRPEALELHRTYIRLMVLAQHRDGLLDEYRSLARESVDWRGPYLLATVCWYAGERNEADRIIRQVHASTSEQLPVRQALAYAELHAGAPARSLELFDGMLASDPCKVEAMEGRGHALLGLDRRADAVRQFRSVVRLEPAVAGYRQALAMGLYAVGELDDALHETAVGLRFDPADPQLQAYRGYLLALDGEKERALEHLELAREAGPGVTTTLFMLAHQHVACGHFARARDLLLEATAIEHSVVPLIQVPATGPVRIRSITESSAAMHGTLGWLLAQSGERLAARRSFERALALDPKESNALVGLARDACAQGDIDAAMQLFRRLEQASASEPEKVAYAMVKQAELSCARRDFEGALPLLRRLASEHDRRFRASVDLPELVRALERARPDAERILIDAIPEVETADRDACAAVAIATVLGFWGEPVEPEVIHRGFVQAQDRSASRIVSYLRSRGMRVIAFPSDPRVMQRLLRQRLPLILLHDVVRASEVGPHASVVTGFDAALEVFALSPRLSDGHSSWLQFSRVPGNIALLVAPDPALSNVDLEIGGIEIAEIRLEYEMRGARGDPQGRILVEQVAAADGAAALPWIDLLAGVSAAADGRAEQAIGWLSRAVERAGFAPTLLEMAAWQLSEHGRSELAVSALRKLLDQAPTHVRATLQLVHLLGAEGATGHAEALRILDDALTLMPDDSELHEMRGRLLMQVDLHKEAEQAFRSAIEEGGSPEVHLDLSWCLLRRERPDLAAARLRRYLATPGVTRCEAAQALLEACTAGR